MQNTDGAVSHEDGCEFRWIPVDEIDLNRFQFRKDLGDISALVESIRDKGIQVPIKVMNLTSGRYRIIYGQRRWMAARMAGLTRMPCLVVDSSDNEHDEMSFIENFHRRDLNLPDHVCALAEFGQRGYTNREIARMVGRSESHVSKAIAGAHFLADAIAGGFITYQRVLELDPPLERVYEAAVEYKKLGDLATATKALEPVAERSGSAEDDDQKRFEEPDPAAGEKGGEGHGAATPVPSATSRRKKDDHQESLRWQLTIGRPVAKRHLGRMLAVLEGVIDVLDEVNLDSIETKSAEEANKIRVLADRLAAIGARFGNRANPVDKK